MLTPFKKHATENDMYRTTMHRASTVHTKPCCDVMINVHLPCWFFRTARVLGHVT